MASTSASSIQKSFKYDVFLSFRGEDTRKNFVDHLHHALQQRSIITYKDDEEIKKGKKISDELIRSIEDSRFYIIVLSKNYASSSWCLNELAKIIECQKRNEQTAFPVFYDVEPTEVRKQSGAVGEAFAKHKEEEVSRKWREALREVADLVGWELKNNYDGHEAKFIQNIVKEISLGIRYINPSADGKLMGMEKRVSEVVSSLELDADDVRMIGIKGMGGGGKTTLAKVVFDQISILFEGSSFVENVREYSKASPCGLKALQKQVLSDVLNDTHITINGVSDLINIMKKIMYGRKVLIVLDDVDHIDQLEALAGELNWFKPGSRIIITTRDEQVLIAHGVPENLILGVNLLSREEANCLFNRYAFGRVIPNQGYEKLACQVIHYAAGLPLTIKVLGSFLRKKDKLEWIDALERLKTIPLKATLDILELSYNSLEEDYKDIFLDVACMLKGWKKEEAIVALESCGLHARSGLKVLELKSLITVSGSEHLGMHDHIQEMGQNIVRRLQPSEPNKHSRLWIAEEIEDILVENKGTEATRCMKVRMADPATVMNGLRKMKQLRFLDMIWRGKYGEDNLCLPNSLLYFRLHGYPFTCLPNSFQANNLVGLKMNFSNIAQLWKERERKVLKKLRFIDLSFCKLRFLDIGLIPNLERLSLVKCDKLVELRMPVENSKLRYLDLNDTELRTLDLERAQNLDTLKVQVCRYLTELRMPVESPKLKHLTIHCSMLKTLNLMQTRNLNKLVLQECMNLLELHMPIESPELEIINICCPKLRTLNLKSTQNLKRLYLGQCGNLLELHMPIEFSRLKTINICCPKLRTLNLTGTRNLERLDLVQCEDLEELQMPIESPKLKIIRIRYSKLRTLYLRLSPYLEYLNIHDRFSFVEIHAPVGCLSGRVRFKPLLVNHGFPMVARSLGICPLHPANSLPKFHFEWIYKELLLLSTLNLVKLISFGPCACTNLASLSGIISHLQCLRKLTLEGSIPKIPTELDQLKFLEGLTLLSTKIEYLPDSICLLKHLKVLELKSCWFLKQLPEDIGRLESLEQLQLTDCRSLRGMPNSICDMKRLKHFHLTKCIYLRNCLRK